MALPNTKAPAPKRSKGIFTAQGWPTSPPSTAPFADAQQTMFQPQPAPTMQPEANPVWNPGGFPGAIAPNPGGFPGGIAPGQQAPMQGGGQPQAQDLLTQYIQQTLMGGNRGGGGAPGLDLNRIFSTGRQVGTGGAEITAQDPTGQGGLAAGGNFFSTPQQVQANLQSGQTTASLSPQQIAANNARRPTGYRMPFTAY